MDLDTSKDASVPQIPPQLPRNHGNAVGGKLHTLAQIEGVDGLDEADTAHLKEVVHALAAVGKLLHHAQHQAQIAGDQLLPGRLVSAAGALQQRADLRLLQNRQLRRVYAADFDFSLQKTPLLFKESGVSISRPVGNDTKAPIKKGAVRDCLLVRRRGQSDGVLVMPEDDCFVGWAAYYLK